MYNNIDAYIYVFIFASPEASLPIVMTHYNKRSKAYILLLKAYVRDIDRHPAKIGRIGRLYERVLHVRVITNHFQGVKTKIRHQINKMKFVFS